MYSFDALYYGSNLPIAAPYRANNHTDKGCFEKE